MNKGGDYVMIEHNSTKEEYERLQEDLNNIVSDNIKDQ